MNEKISKKTKNWHPTPDIGRWSTLSLCSCSSIQNIHWVTLPRQQENKSNTQHHAVQLSIYSQELKLCHLYMSADVGQLLQHAKSLSPTARSLVITTVALATCLWRICFLSRTQISCAPQVFLHKFHIIVYASRKLSPREQYYAVIDKKALAIVFGITKFHQYVYDRHFTLQTDHKPLKRILGAHREVPKMVANRLQCWALTLSAYDYELKVGSRKGECSCWFFV